MVDRYGVHRGEPNIISTDLTTGAEVPVASECVDLISTVEFEATTGSGDSGGQSWFEVANGLLHVVFGGSNNNRATCSRWTGTAVYSAQNAIEARGGVFTVLCLLL